MNLTPWVTQALEVLAAIALAPVFGRLDREVPRVAAE